MSNPVQRMPAVPPVWATDPGTTVEPTLSERQAGWAVDQKPPARWQNDYQRKAYQFLDILQEALLKDWRPGLVHTEVTTVDITAIGWHEGYFYIGADGNYFRSYDGRVWQLVGALPITGTMQSFTSNGSRIVMGASGGRCFFSDNDGTSWATCIGPGAGGATRVFYMPQADIWIGQDDITLNAMVSTDGETYVAASPGSGYGDTVNNAENADGSIVLLSNVYSVDTGASWAFTTNNVLEGFIYSALLGNFIGWNTAGSDTALHVMSGVAGTWEPAAFVTLADVTVFNMFEMRGMLYAVVSNDVDGPLTANELWLSRDLGLTWEVAAALGNLESADKMFVAHPENGHTPGISSGYAALTIGPLVTTPVFAGVNFAAALAP